MESISGSTALALTLALLACVYWLPLTVPFILAPLLAGLLAFATWRLMLTKNYQAATIAALSAAAAATLAGVLAPSIGRAALWTTVLATGGASLFASIYLAKLARKLRSR
jgi:hypothetical protein